METFLAFLAKDIGNAPETIKPMTGELAGRIDRLVEAVCVSQDEALGEDTLF